MFLSVLFGYKGKRSQSEAKTGFASLFLKKNVACVNVYARTTSENTKNIRRNRRNSSLTYIYYILCTFFIWLVGIGLKVEFCMVRARDVLLILVWSTRIAFVIKGRQRSCAWDVLYKWGEKIYITFGIYINLCILKQQTISSVINSGKMIENYIYSSRDNFVS